MPLEKKCKICRRQGAKLFLKGERCLSPKCALIKRPYPPGEKRKRKTGALSEYGKELREKQKLKFWYNLRENQFKRYVKEALEKRGKGEDLGEFLIRKLELRLDNVVFRLGFAQSRSQARQLVSHGHILVNNKKVNIPSFQVKKGDKIKVKESSLKKGIFKELLPKMKDYQPPNWLKVNFEKMEGEIVELPHLKEIQPPADLHLIFEFYSK